VRGAAILLFLAAAAAADPFAPKREELPMDDAAYARHVETLALLKEAAPRDPAGSFERAVAMLEPFGLAERFEEPIATALAGATEEGPARGGLLSLYGHLLVARGTRNGNVWVFGPGNVVQREEIDDETRKMLETASEMLREAIRLRPADARAREDLATALETLDSEKNAEEVARLQAEAAALRMAGQAPPEPPKPDESEKLRGAAEELEQREKEPDHAGALLLRKQALVCEFCAHTIPFAYDPALYGPVSLLAPEDVVVRNLTRTYRKRDGAVDTVPPTYHPAKPEHRARIAEGLGRDPGPAAGAALLKLLATAWERDLVAEAALRGLAQGNHEAVRRHLPALLGATVCRSEEPGPFEAQMREMRNRLRAFGVEPPVAETGTEYGPMGQALLVEAAVALKVKEAAPVLAALLPLEDDLVRPRGIARALGELGGAEQADALLAVARDPSRDIWFRREAILALGRLAPARLGEVPAEPHLELAIAAARYRAEPTEALRGRLLQGLGHPHEADDAARYLLELHVREAIPDLERFLAEKPDHYAAPAVKSAYDRLVNG
jgi:hypothetical protein